MKGRKGVRRFNLFSCIYSVYALTWGAVLLLLLFPFALFVTFFSKPLLGDKFYKGCRVFARIWLFVTGMRYEEVQIGNVINRMDGPYIYIANHRSYIDIILMLASMRLPYRPLGKAQMARLPLFGYFYKHFTVMVDRGDTFSRLKSLIDLRRMIAAQISVFIFPEGTFNESEYPLKAFHGGAFQLALKNGINIRPIVFLDNLERMHYSSLFAMRPGRCRVAFMEEIDINQFTSVKSGVLKQEVYNNMYDVLMEYGA